MLYLRTKDVLVIFWCLSVYLLQHFSWKGTHYGTERTWWRQKKFPKILQTGQKFVRFFYESYEQPHWKNQNPQHWKQPLREKSHVCIHNHFIDALKLHPVLNLGVHLWQRLAVNWLPTFSHTCAAQQLTPLVLTSSASTSLSVSPFP